MMSANRGLELRSRSVWDPATAWHHEVLRCKIHVSCNHTGTIHSRTAMLVLNTVRMWYRHGATEVLGSQRSYSRGQKSTNAILSTSKSYTF